MPSMQFELAVEMEDGSTYQVVADQRDIARWEVQPFGYPFQLAETKGMMMPLRFLAWSVSTRQGKTTLPWDQWNDTCVEASAPEDETESGIPADAEDPGHPVP